MSVHYADLVTSTQWIGYYLICIISVLLVDLTHLIFVDMVSLYRARNNRKDREIMFVKNFHDDYDITDIIKWRSEKCSKGPGNESVRNITIVVRPKPKQGNIQPPNVDDPPKVKS